MVSHDKSPKMRILPTIVLALSVLYIAAACGRKPAGETVEFHSTPGASGPSAQVSGVYADDPSLADTDFDPRGDYAVIFNDSNKRQWEGAEPLGIEPVSDLNSIWRMRRPLVHIKTNKDFVVEELTQSYPYLVPEADSALHTIGQRFTARAKEVTGGDYRIRVTSVLRTKSQVRSLQRVNKNAVDSSVHMLGTTCDISYASFADSQGNPVSQPQLKAVLARVLYDMRRQGYIWVKYEKKQPCFHLSVHAR